MSEERERVLRMLEEGKITAEQAARLIEALGRPRSAPGGPRSEGWLPPPRPPRPARVRMADLDRIPDIVASAVSSAMKSGFGAREGELRTEFPGKSSLFLKSVSGDVTVSGWDEDRIAIEGNTAMTRVREREDIVMVRTISGDFSVSLPREARFEVTTVSGDVKVEGVGGRFALKAVSGDVRLTGFAGEARVQTVSGEARFVDFAGRVEVESKSGDIELLTDGAVGGSVVSKSGEVALCLGERADVLLDLECEESGGIEFDAGLAHEVVEQAERRLKVRIGAGTQELKVRTSDADINVRRRKED
ncbi:MAG TPA: hypothetical protein ENN51_06710 [candidate division WOR-3 bacterium]|uniref:Adhesin domain-containing protein n=1 Tax=candidate division WOR-3 bacterium TaxID=2052148 RepID=A0A7V0T6Q3_UNCW3|nr:hypothetical protein [candidate division WOR-3 bacterium]